MSRGAVEINRGAVEIFTKKYFRGQWNFYPVDM